MAPIIPNIGIGGMRTGSQSMLSAVPMNPASTAPTAPGINPAIPRITVNNGLNTGVGNPINTQSFGAPTVPIPFIRPHNLQQTHTGTVVNAATGGVVNTPTAPSLPGVDNNYMVQPGETNDQYTARVAAYNTQKNATTPTLPNTDTTTSQEPSPLSSPMFTSPEYEAAQKAYQTAQQLTPEEIANQTAVSNLDQSYNSAYTNTSHQAIPLEFITGQQKNLQDQALSLSKPLQDEATLLQSKRQATLEASKFALQTASDRLAAYRDYSKPVAIGYGGSLVQPRTADGNPAGTVISGAFGGSGGSNTTDLIGTAMAEGRITPDLVTRYGIPFLANALQKDPGYNFVTQKASISSNTESLQKQQDYLDTTTRAYNTATANLDVLQKFMADNHINNMGIPSLNDIDNWAKSRGIDPGSVAAFKSSLEGLRSEYAQVLSRGGQVTDTARNSASSLIPDNLSPAQLSKVATQLNLEGQNSIKEAGQQLQTIKGRIKNGGTENGSKGSFTEGTTAAAGGLIFKDGKWQVS